MKTRIFPRRVGRLSVFATGLMADEPFSKLDTALRDDLRAFTFAHSRSRGIPALMVTHDPADAEAAGGPVIELTATP